LARRVEEAERKFQAADLDKKLKELEDAKHRQVKKLRKICQLSFSKIRDSIFVNFVLTKVA